MSINAKIVDLSEIIPVRCACGWARRAFTELTDVPISIHRVEIAEDARAHYHKNQTETYYILHCEAGAGMELDGEITAVREGVVVMIPAGVKHRAVGRMTILNVVCPPFDPADEWFD